MGKFSPLGDRSALGRPDFWQTNTRFEQGIGTNDYGQFYRQYPQQNMKFPNNEHVYYDPMTQRSGWVGGQAERGSH